MASQLLWRSKQRKYEPAGKPILCCKVQLVVCRDAEVSHLCFNGIALLLHNNVCGKNVQGMDEDVCT